MTKYFIFAIVAIGLLGWGFWSLVGGLPWYWIVAIVVGLWFFGALALRGIGALGTAAGLLFVAIFLILDKASKNRRNKRWEREEAKRRQGPNGPKGY